jgi:DNA-nicking Smr family endonuclease
MVKQLRHETVMSGDKRPAAEEDEAQLLQEALHDVTPLAGKPRVTRRNGLRSARGRTKAEDEDRNILEALVCGRIPFDWIFHPDYREGGPEVKNRQLLRKLRRGEFAVQAELDLHGMTQSEALAALEEFLAASVTRGIRCVRVIHGKGTNSQGGQGVLRRRLPQWLSMRRLAQYVIAYTTAQPHDGGIGATYVLLRKHPQRGTRVRL